MSSWDAAMEDFIRNHLSNNTCAPRCEGSTLANDVDVTNFLKTFAVFAVLMHSDSPIGNGNNYYLAEEGLGTGWKIVPYDLDNAATRVGTQICNEQCPNRMVHWSIVRPTCKALEENQLAGPLLSDPVLLAEYIGYVRDFVYNIMGDTTFQQEIENHGRALQADVISDAWNAFYSHDYAIELSSSAPWYSEGNPLLVVLRARFEDVKDQLEASDDGSYAQVASEEVCLDWRGDDIAPDSCYNNCQYEGCYEPYWTVPGVCDANFTGLCYHGEYDENCTLIPNGETYPGMPPRGDEIVFCQESVRLSACLPPEFVEETPEPTEAGTTPSTAPTQGGTTSTTAPTEGGTPSTTAPTEKGTTSTSAPTEGGTSMSTEGTQTSAPGDETPTPLPNAAEQELDLSAGTIVSSGLDLFAAAIVLLVYGVAI